MSVFDNFPSYKIKRHNSRASRVPYENFLLPKLTGDGKSAATRFYEFGDDLLHIMDIVSDEDYSLDLVCYVRDTIRNAIIYFEPARVIYTLNAYEAAQWRNSPERYNGMPYPSKYLDYKHPLRRALEAVAYDFELTYKSALLLQNYVHPAGTNCKESKQHLKTQISYVVTSYSILQGQLVDLADLLTSLPKERQ